eukprot:8992790-Pyramimonas_sp.AAC.1
MPDGHAALYWAAQAIFLISCALVKLPVTSKRQNSSGWRRAPRPTRDRLEACPPGAKNASSRSNKLSSRCQRTSGYGVVAHDGICEAERQALEEGNPTLVFLQTFCP